MRASYLDMEQMRKRGREKRRAIEQNRQRKNC